MRERFSSRKTAILAMAGSAIGLGNIWRFPYVMGDNGGAAFIIIYILCTILLSMPIFLSESIIGRTAESSTIGAFRKLAPGSVWKWLGILTIASPMIILSYYSVVGGWSFNYLAKSLTLSFSGGAANEEGIMQMFSDFISDPTMSFVCHTVFLLATAIIVLGGVKKGIEKFSNITMPVLFIMMVIIIVYSLSMDGAMAGVEFLVKPDFSKIDGNSVIAAMGQSFYSLSLGVGTILTYSSYVSKKEDILATGAGTAAFDLFFALIAGLAIMPAVFASGLDSDGGPGLVFQTLPIIFARMSETSAWLSSAVAILFFLSIFVAALTSSISMFEVGTAYLVEEKHMSRRKAVLVVFALCWVVGIFCALSFGPLSDVKIFGYGIFDACDKFASNVLMTIGGLLFTIFVGWKMSKKTVRDEFTCNGTIKRNCLCFDFVYFLIKYVAPVAILVIFVSNIFS